MRRSFLLLLALLTAGLCTGGRPAFAAPPQVLLVFGDSLSAEYGLVRGSGWVALLERRLQQSGRDIQVVNASVSGETTAGGRSRISGVLARVRPRWVLVELGANDALRGLALDDYSRAAIDKTERELLEERELAFAQPAAAAAV